MTKQSFTECRLLKYNNWLHFIHILHTAYATNAGKCVLRSIPEDVAILPAAKVQPTCLYVRAQFLHHESYKLQCQGLIYLG